jgi:hypothetical protein
MPNLVHKLPECVTKGIAMAAGDIMYAKMTPMVS